MDVAFAPTREAAPCFVMSLDAGIDEVRVMTVEKEETKQVKEEPNTPNTKKWKSPYQTWSDVLVELHENHDNWKGMLDMLGQLPYMTKEHCNDVARIAECVTLLDAILDGAQTEKNEEKEGTMRVAGHDHVGDGVPLPRADEVDDPVLKRALNELKRLNAELIDVKQEIERSKQTATLLKQEIERSKTTATLRDEIHGRFAAVKRRAHKICMVMHTIESSLEMLYAFRHAEASLLALNLDASCPEGDDASTDDEQEVTEQHKRMLCVSTLRIYASNGLMVQQLTSFDERRPNELFSLSGDATKHALLSFNTTFQKCFGAAQFVTTPGTHQSYRHHLQLFGQALCHQDSKRPGKPGRFMIPSPVAKEVQCVQPYMQTFFRSLGTTLSVAQRDDAKSEGTSPRFQSEHQIKPIPTCPSDADKKERFVDHATGADARHIYILCNDDAVEIPVEVKTFCNLAGPYYLIQTALETIRRRLARHVDVGFHFAGIGTDARATAVIATPSCLVLSQLRLLNMGTKDARLELLQTEILPLLSESNYYAWIESSVLGTKKLELAKKLGKEMYESDRVHRQFTRLDIPTGIVVLAKVVSSSRSELFGPPLSTTVKDTSKAIELGHMLGFGAFAAVYECKSPLGCVAKISRYSAQSDLQVERNFLYSLAQESNGAFLPRVETGDRSIVFDIHGVRKPLPVLVMKPKAISLELAIATRLEVAGFIKKLCMDLASCLQFVHKHNYFHNDISPKNLMVEPESMQAFLIDFGLATKKGDLLRGFRGSRLYVRRRIYETRVTKEWEAVETDDQAALALSMAVVLNGTCPWSTPNLAQTIGGSEDRTSWAMERCSLAEEILTEMLRGELSEKNLEMWLNWCKSSTE